MWLLVLTIAKAAPGAAVASVYASCAISGGVRCSVSADKSTLFGCRSMKHDRLGSVLVCDDLLIGINGKWTAVGIYTGDIGLIGPEQIIPQMVFLFTAETAADNPWKSLVFEVRFPGEETPGALNFSLPPQLTSHREIAKKL